MPLTKFLARKHRNPRIHGDSDRKATKAFIFNRSWMANQWILLVTPLMVLGFGLISYAAFALPITNPAGYIDYPTPGAVIGGVNTYMSGWAVAPTGTNHVDIVVNGVPARASYGTGAARPDVCALEPYHVTADCLPVRGNLVGWQYYFNSTSMPNGTYSLYAAFYGNSGGVTYSPAQTFTVANQPPAINIDTPAEGETVSGFRNVGGWAIDSASFYESGISSLVMSIEGVTNLFYPIYGAARQDVCNYYGYRANCPNVGFNYNLDTSLVPNGWHAMHLTATDLNGQSSVYTRIVNFSNAVTTPPTGPGTSPGGGGGGTTTPPTGGPAPGGNGYLDGFIDDPKPSATYTGGVTFDGWAIGAKTVVTNVTVYVDNVSIGTARYGSGAARSDVCANHAGWLNCPTGYIGWQLYYDTSKLANGSHTIKAVVNDGDYPPHPYATPTVNFTTRNTVVTTTPPTTTNLQPDVYIDGIYSENFQYIAKGWALDNKTKSESAITKIVATVDGKTLSTVTTGLSRPDVCTTYPGRAGCPNVGWSTLFDPEALPDGQHYFQVTATDATGLSRTASVPFSTGSSAGDCGGGGGAESCESSDALTGRSRKDRVPGSGQKIHVMYMVPSDGTDRHLDTNGAITASLNSIQNYMRQQTAHSFKFDVYQSKFDITFIKTAHSKAYYKAQGDIVNAIMSDISATGNLSMGKKYAVYFEGGGNSCGISNYGFSPSVGIAAMGGTQDGTNCGLYLAFNSRATNPRQAFVSDLLLTHEILHGLGAVNVCGSHYSTQNGGHHVTDGLDIMTYLAVQPTAKIDIGGDSYWNAASLPANCPASANLARSPYIN